MKEAINIAVLGATGAVGETVLSILAERHFPAKQIFALASSRSKNDVVMCGKKPLSVIDAAEFDFSRADIAIFSAGASISRQYAPIAAQNHCVVIDNTSEFRYQDDIPLVVPEVNPEKIADYKNRFIIANPNCSTIQMLVALKPLYDAVGITRINVATYQAVSGAGRNGIQELVGQTGSLLNGQPIENKAFPLQIAFNVVPQIDAFQDNGYTREEMKMVWETKKIFNDPDILVNPTAVRVPVFYGHSEAIHIETRQKLTATQAQALLKTAPGVTVVDNNEQGHYPTPVTEAIGQDSVYIGRIREDISHPHGLNLWVVADNIRKGAALNAVQIAEILLSEHL